MWILTETAFEYDDERYSSNGGYHVQQVFKSKDEVKKRMDSLNLDFVRGMALSEYYEYEWRDFKDEFFALWDENAAVIAVHCEVNFPGYNAPPYEYDDAFHKLMEILPDEKVLEFMNKNMKQVAWGFQEVEVVE